ncbi:MAG: arylamine N-acetyltransferase [bacterium]
MDTENYLKKLSVESSVKPSVEYLTELHYKHLLTFPFENLDIHNSTPIVIDVKNFYEKIINNNRGGFCYELNGLFNELLSAAGYKTYFVSCNIFISDEKGFSPDYDHIAIVVQTEDGEYLADVGFGDNFLKPLKLIYNKSFEQYGVHYRLSKIDSDELLLEKSRNGSDYIREYKFRLLPKELNDFAERCHYQQTSPQSHFLEGKICSIATTKGRISLSDKKLIITNDVERNEITINSKEEFDKLLFEYFKIKL